MGMTMPRYAFDSTLLVVLTAVLGLYFFDRTSEIAHTLLVVAAMVGTAPVFARAVRSLREREWASMDTLAGVALVFALVNAEWASAVFIALMLAAARIVGEITESATQNSLTSLLKLRPEHAKVLRGGVLVETTIADIRVGDLVVVDIGERVPVDGVVTEGQAALDQSSLTGESVPVDASIGDEVFSSTLVASGSVTIKAEKVGADTTLERIVRLVEAAQKEKPHAATLGEKFGKLYLVGIFVASIALYAFTQNVSLVLAVVLVVCADDVAVAVPLAYLRAIASATKRGIIIKGGRYLETLGTVDTFIFDKTGTLTTGMLSIENEYPAPGIALSDLQSALALASIRSSHPLSVAVAAHSKSRGIEAHMPEHVREVGGKGIVVRDEGIEIAFGKAMLFDELGIAIPNLVSEQAQERSDDGQSISYVSRAGVVLGFVAAHDTIKGNAKESIAALKSLGIKKVVMLTGDNERVAKRVAAELGIDEFHAELLPEDKVAIIRSLQGVRPVAMVGDGINDAAALSLSDVGIAMGAMGSEGTVESAQIVLMRDDLSALPQVVELARMARQVSIQDFWIWGLSNVVGLTLVFTGIIGPSGAAAYNFLSDFFPLFNSVRVRIRRP